MYDQQATGRSFSPVNLIAARRSKERAILERLAQTSSAASVWLPTAVGANRIVTPLLDRIGHRVRFNVATGRTLSLEPAA
jgi:hypothetical protein